MAYTRKQLREMAITYLGDDVNEDKLGGSLNNSALSFTATDGTRFSDNQKIEINAEAMRTDGDPSGNTVAIFKRGAYSTTAAAHNSGDIIRINPTYFAWQIHSAINDCLSNRVLKVAENVAAITTTGEQRYDLPAAIKLENILGVWIYSDDGKFREQIKKCRGLKGSGTAGADQLEFLQRIASGLKVHIQYLTGYSALDTDAATNPLPDNETAQQIPLWWACYTLISARETPRMKRDKGGFKRSSPPVGARERTSYDWRADFISACRSAGLHPNIPGYGPVVSRQTFITEY
jgi:hypothetical protein